MPRRAEGLSGFRKKTGPEGRIKKTIIEFVYIFQASTKLENPA